jgi:hypothetical protein
MIAALDRACDRLEAAHPVALPFVVFAATAVFVVLLLWVLG